MNIFTQIDRLRVSKLFNGGIAVDVHEDKKLVSVAFVSTMGQVFTKELKDSAVTVEAFLDAIVEVTNKAHNTAKELLADNGSALVLKAISSTAFGTPLKDNLSKSSKDRKVAVEFKETTLASFAAEAAFEAEQAAHEKAVAEAKLAEAKAIIASAETKSA